MPQAKPYPKEQQLGSSRKKYRRKVASRKTWEKLRDERLGPCLVCQYGTHHGNDLARIELHHVVPRDRFGDDVAENLVPLCSGCHDMIEARRPMFLRHLAEEIQQSEPAVYAYAIDKLGEDGFLRLHSVKFKCAIDESAGLADA